jgi:putative PIG3 family NAD(P)H quinone oxidoreductase
MVRARAVRIREPGAPEVLEIGEVELREPGPYEVLVEVAAAGLNRADTLQRRGFYPAPPGAPEDVPGLEYAGTVSAVGEAVTSWTDGDRVMGIVAGGGMATHVVVHEREAIPVPEGLELARAAAIPEVFLTAWDALFLQAGASMGKTVVLHSVGSGVGTAGLQLLCAAGAIVIGTSRTEDKLERCRRLGLERAVLVEGGAFATDVKRLTGGVGADVILDGVGAAYLGENLEALAPRGTLIVLGLMGGVAAELPLGRLLQKRARILGTVLRARPLEEKAALAQRFRHEVLPLFAAGVLEPVVDEVLPMAEVAEAHRRMEANETFGKLVLAW